MKHIEVVAAIILFGKKVLCVQRGKHKFEYISQKYEFPGGKVEPNETNKEAIKREISEELQMNIEISSYFMTVEHQYPDFRITMECFQCRCETDRVVLTEHINYQWLSVEELKSLDWAAADIPIVQKLIGVGNGAFFR
jgi:8-oxo-dGTP diphosphatase